MEFIVAKNVTEDSKNIRLEVFVDEQGFDEEFDDIDDRAFHVILYIDGLAVATGRTFEKSQDIYKFGRIAVRKDCRGQGFGVEIVQKLEQVALEQNAKKVVLSSQYHAKDFYEKCGFSVVGEPYLEEGAKHIFMEKNI
ncbi:MAG: GNAT family N-acetyltransferase [Clostridia bacterium]